MFRKHNFKNKRLENTILKTNVQKHNFKEKRIETQF